MNMKPAQLESDYRRPVDFYLVEKRHYPVIGWLVDYECNNCGQLATTFDDGPVCKCDEGVSNGNL